MSTKKKTAPAEKIKERHNFTLVEITELMVKDKGITSGKFELTIDFQIGVGSFGPTPNEKYPGAAVSISQVGIVETDKDGPFVVDASTLGSIED